MEGLTEKEVKERLKKFGFNELSVKKEYSDLKVFLEQFKSPLIYILVFAGLVTLFLQDFIDTSVIFAAVLMNTVLGFFQERKAQKALSALRSFLVQKTKVIRNGQRKTINARELVPGDLVILELGSRVPADGTLVKAKDLSINEAILTGESMPVKKGLKENKVFMGTTVATGIAKMIVIKTGMETEMGKIGEKVSELREEKTPLQIQLDKLAKILVWAVAVVTVFIFGFGELLGYGHLEMFTTSVAIAVAAIPEGLVVTLTVILSLGMQRILRERALVRKLLAAETLGSVSVICCDKTGTLTEGKMKVVKAVPAGRQAIPEVRNLPNTRCSEIRCSEMLAKAAVLCNDLRNPMEMVMASWGEENLKLKKVGRSDSLKELKKQYPRLDEIPFSPEYKYIATLHAHSGSVRMDSPGVGNILFVSGAPEVVLGKCKMTNDQLETWKEKFKEYGKQGYRMVGFAHKKVDTSEVKLKSGDIKNLSWLGILLFEDPVRKGVATALKECQRAGIKVKVITGDYVETAKSVLTKLGLWQKESSKAITGEELESMTINELKERIDDVVLFARVNPHQKVRIVEVLQDKGESVAMTGDGVNDAPALKKAEIGIVVNEASDVAKETADIVLLNSSFSTIVAAIEEGRAIFENIKKVVLYLLSDSFTEVILVVGSMFLGLPLPLTAAQILWINLVEDGLPGIALAFEPKEKGLMREKPRSKKAPILDLEMKVLIFIIGIFTDLILLVLLFFLTRGLFHLPHVQTIIFAGLAIDSLVYVFSCRSLKQTIFQQHPFGNKTLNIAVVISLFFLFIAIYFPPLQVFLGTHALNFKEILLVLAIGAFNIIVIEATKWVFISRHHRVDREQSFC